MINTFKGGIWPEDHKYSLNNHSINLDDPPYVSFNLFQYKGVSALPVVKIGSYVYMGQLIAEIKGGLGVPLHSSISGTVTSIESIVYKSTNTYIITIENDFQNLLCPSLLPFGKRISEASIDEIISVIRKSGILDNYGTQFPVYQRIKTLHRRCSHLLINCTEPEPFITSRHCMIMENYQSLINGIKILMISLNIKQVTIAVETNRKDEIELLSRFINSSINIVKVTSKYPINNDIQLLKAALNINLKRDQSCIDKEIGIFNAETCIRIYDAFSKGIPQIKQYITIDGDCINKSNNIVVPLGTPISNIISFNGGFINKPKKLIHGGPLTGNLITSETEVITKSSNGILALGDYFIKSDKINNCISCDKCLNVCPQKLIPKKIVDIYNSNNFEQYLNFKFNYCIGCSCCSYICPANIPIKEMIIEIETRINTERE